MDGSGLLPGESISRHRTARPEPEATEPTVQADAVESAFAPDSVEEQEFLLAPTEEEEQEAAPALESHRHVIEEPAFEQDEYEETSETASDAHSVEPVNQGISSL